MAPVIGLDIGATKTHGVVVDEGGMVVVQVRQHTERGAAGVVRSAARVLTELTAHRDVLGPVGVGVPGVVDPVGGLVSHAVNLGIDGVPVALADLLEAEVGRRVMMENDVNVATLGVAALTGSSDLAYLGIGTGLAAGLVVDGRLRRGARGTAGEIGHVSVDPAGLLCACGQRGCLETIASGSSLAAAWPTTDQAPARSLYAAVLSGDGDALALWERFADGLSRAVTVLALGVDPEIVVLGGGVAEVGEPLREAVVQALRRRADGSSFIASLGLPERVRLVPEAPIAAIGAAMLTAG